MDNRILVACILKNHCNLCRHRHLIHVVVKNTRIALYHIRIKYARLTYVFGAVGEKQRTAHIKGINLKSLKLHFLRGKIAYRLFLLRGCRFSIGRLVSMSAEISAQNAFPVILLCGFRFVSGNIHAHMGFRVYSAFIFFLGLLLSMLLFPFCSQLRRSLSFPRLTFLSLGFCSCPFFFGADSFFLSLCLSLSALSFRFYASSLRRLLFSQLFLLSPCLLLRGSCCLLSFHTFSTFQTAPFSVFLCGVTRHDICSRTEKKHSCQKTGCQNLSFHSLSPVE